MPLKYAKSAQQHQKERQDKARKREAKKARQSLERTRAYTDARLENEPNAGAEDTTLFDETSASSVQGKDKATVAKKTKRATNAAKEPDEEKYDQKAEVAAQTLRAGEQRPNKPDLPLPNHDGLLKELNSHLEMFASSSKEEDVLSHTRDGSSDNEESNELSSEEESDYDHAREESPDEDSWEYVEWIP